MKERPIIMSAPMVRALLDGTKAQTRRVVKPQPTHFNPAGVPRRASAFYSPSDVIHCPYGQPGDRLWVREAWTVNLTGDAKRGGPGTVPIYRAEYPNATDKWRPSTHMPRWASRITLEITDVRVERLQDISEADAIAEGVPPDQLPRQDDDAAAFWRIGKVRGDSFPIARYAALWEDINGHGSWDVNPWVWAISFKLVQP